MRSVKRSMVALAVAGSVLLASSAAASDPIPNLHVAVPSTVCITGTTKCAEIPPGRFLEQSLWDKLDAEMKRLQDAETRLTAENKSLRKAQDGWQPGWKTLVVTLAAGIAGGWYIHDHL